MIYKIWFGILGLINHKLINKKIGILPKNISGYKLVKQLYFNKPNNDFYFGLYTKDKNKYFIKCYLGTNKSLEYFKLINEYNAGTFLSKVNSAKYGVNIIKPINIIYRENSLLVVYPYMTIRKGGLSKSSILSTNTILYKIYSKSNRLNLQLQKNTIGYFIFLLFVYLVLNIFKNPKNIRDTFSIFLKALRRIKFTNTKLTLCHGDLNEDNVRLIKNKLHIIDLEDMFIGPTDYDKAYYYTNHKFNLSKSTNEKSNNFEFLYFYNQLKFAYIYNFDYIKTP